MNEWGFRVSSNRGSHEESVAMESIGAKRSAFRQCSKATTRHKHHKVHLVDEKIIKKREVHSVTEPGCIGTEISERSIGQEIGIDIFHSDACRVRKK